MTTCLPEKRHCGRANPAGTGCAGLSRLRASRAALGPSDAAREVTLLYQGGPEVRHVHLTVPHSAHPPLSWYGESVGHYKGDTLVIDTIGLNERFFVDNYRVLHTSQLHVAERYRLTGGGQTLDVAFTVEDPGTFPTRWSALQRYGRVHQAALVEQPCHGRQLQIFQLRHLSDARRGKVGLLTNCRGRTRCRSC